LSWYNCVKLQVLGRFGQVQMWIESREGMSMSMEERLLRRLVLEGETVKEWGEGISTGKGKTGGLRFCESNKKILEPRGWVALKYTAFWSPSKKLPVFNQMDEFVEIVSLCIMKFEEGFEFAMMGPPSSARI
jgi:hypothetical protein